MELWDQMCIITYMNIMEVNNNKTIPTTSHNMRRLRNYLSAKTTSVWMTLLLTCYLTVYNLLKRLISEMGAKYTYVPDNDEHMQKCIKTNNDFCHKWHLSCIICAHPIWLTTGIRLSQRQSRVTRLDLWHLAKEWGSRPESPLQTKPHRYHKR